MSSSGCLNKKLIRAMKEVLEEMLIDYDRIRDCAAWRVEEEAMSIDHGNIVIQQFLQEEEEVRSASSS